MSTRVSAVQTESRASGNGFASHEETLANERVSRLLGGAVFTLLLLLIAFSAVPYGTAQPWWKGFFICGVAAISILWILDGARSGSWRTGAESLLLPVIALAALAFLQTINLGSSQPPISTSAWNAISADPFGTRFFALQLLSLVLVAALLYRYVNSTTRLQTLAHVIILICVASALFAILRQTTQHSPGFGLPFIKPDQGFGQFINRNHFAFLMEMGFGLTLGIIIGGGVKRERVLIYVGALLPIWTALVLSNSRGGLIAMLAQIVTAVLLFTVLPFSTGRDADEGGEPRRSWLRSWAARVVLLSVLIAGVVVGTVWVGGDRLLTRIEQGQEFAQVESEVRQNARRNQIWRATWRMFAAHPILGVGLGGYWTAIPGFHDASGVMTPQEAHNDYLELLASGGIIGFTVGMWFMVLLFRKTKFSLLNSSGFRRAAGFGATLGIVGVAVHSLVDFGLHMLVNAAVFTALIVIATLPTESFPMERRTK